MIGNVPYGVSAILAYTPEQRAAWIASCEEMLADWDANAAQMTAEWADVELEDLITYNRAVLDGVRAQIASRKDPA